MNTTQQKDQKTQADDGSKRGESAQRQEKMTSSQQATQQARKGEPLPAERPRDRSPKQENL